jgi:hypothetical protein
MYYRIHVEIKFLNDPTFPPQWYTFNTCPARSVGLREPPPL